jgi:hypothetical protein
MEVLMVLKIEFRLRVNIINILHVLCFQSDLKNVLLLVS